MLKREVCRWMLVFTVERSMFDVWCEGAVLHMWMCASKFMSMLLNIFGTFNFECRVNVNFNGIGTCNFPVHVGGQLFKNKKTIFARMWIWCSQDQREGGLHVNRSYCLCAGKLHCLCFSVYWGIAVFARFTCSCGDLLLLVDVHSSRISFTRKQLWRNDLKHTQAEKGDAELVGIESNVEAGKSVKLK